MELVVEFSVLVDFSGGEASGADDGVRACKLVKHDVKGLFSG